MDPEGKKNRGELTYELVARASLVGLLDAAEEIDGQTRLAIERAVAELDPFEASTGSGNQEATDTSHLISLDRAIAAIQVALASATAVSVLVALGTAGRQLAQARLALNEAE